MNREGPEGESELLQSLRVAFGAVKPTPREAATRFLGTAFRFVVCAAITVLNIFLVFWAVVSLPSPVPLWKIAASVLWLVGAYYVYVVVHRPRPKPRVAWLDESTHQAKLPGEEFLVALMLLVAWPYLWAMYLWKSRED